LSITDHHPGQSAFAGPRVVVPFFSYWGKNEIRSWAGEERSTLADGQVGRIDERSRNGVWVGLPG